MSCVNRAGTTVTPSLAPVTSFVDPHRELTIGGGQLEVVPDELDADARGEPG